LVIDIDPAIRDLWRRTLEDKGYRVWEALDGLKGLEVFNLHPTEIALILMDLHMPRLSGYEVTAAVRKINPAVKVMVVTGYPPADLDRLEGVQVFEKPLNTDELIRAVAVALP
jgi:CheY-like chemotaxis protein